MRTIGRRLSYANVVSTLALFLVLTGGAAYASHQLSRRSVGSSQLKSNAVTTAKIKANAVTTRKIKRIAISGDKLKEGAVSTEKLADDAVDTEKIDLADVPFSRISARMHTFVPKTLESEVVEDPLSPSSYTQAANEIDSYAGALQVTFPAKCKSPRYVEGDVVLDEVGGGYGLSQDLASGKFEDAGVGLLNTTVELPPTPRQSLKFEPGTATNHTVTLVLAGECEGGGSGIVVNSGDVDVIATR
jgi:hypothetical protein